MPSEQPAEYTLEEFRKEIGEISKETENEADFPEEIETAVLTEGDMAVWRKIRDNSIEMSDIEEYRKNFLNENGFENKTRYNFLMFVSNKANVIIGKREAQV